MIETARQNLARSISVKDAIAARLDALVTEQDGARETVARLNREIAARDDADRRAARAAMARGDGDVMVRPSDDLERRLRLSQAACDDIGAEIAEVRADLVAAEADVERATEPVLSARINALAAEADAAEAVLMDIRIKMAGARHLRTRDQPSKFYVQFLPMNERATHHFVASDKSLISWTSSDEYKRAQSSFDDWAKWRAALMTDPNAEFR